MLDLPRLRYLHNIATQPEDAWEGFYHPAYAGSNLEYLFQIAFAGYALVAMQRQVPAWAGPDTPITDALMALTRRMLHPRVWRYWAARRTDPDPIHDANIMYSGHTSCLLSLTELLSSETHFDAPFDLDQPEGHVATYTHAAVARAIARQMRAAASHGVACEPGIIYVCCNNHAALSNILYDQCHPGEDCSAVNADWLAWVKQRMVLAPWHGVLPGPPGGILSAAHMAPRDFSYPFASNFTDAWGLALMTPYAPDLARDLAPRLWRRLHRDSAGLHLPSMPLLTRAEASDAALNTGFAYVLARELGADAVADGLRAWAMARLGPQSAAEHAWLTGEHSALYTTALFALGDAIAPGGLADLFAHVPRYDASQPRVRCDPFPQVAFSQAVWDASAQTLHLHITTNASTTGATVIVEHLPSAPQLALDLPAQWTTDDGRLTIAVPPHFTGALAITCTA
jgi:hypothetical protein